MRSSSWMTICASSMSRCSSASIVRSSCSTTMSRPPIAAPSIRASSSWKCWRVVATRASLAELARDVLLGPGVARRGEDLLGRRVLDELAHEHERGRVGDARGLLHVVGDDHDRVALLEVLDEVLDLQGRDRVEGRARLVHEDHVGLQGDRPGDAQALLLAAGEADPRLVEPVLDLVPEPRADQRALNPLAEVDALDSAQPKAGRDVV